VRAGVRSHFAGLVAMVVAIGTVVGAWSCS